ncbi:hypothetical protein [Planococcus sp. YIM B11945]|uniref:hypothetical protein n=1 Tax=Planococcus sp. YIM B11945 TaxID=3435410 RepID=UPI003D7C4781
MTLKHYSKRYDVIMNGNLPSRRKELMLAGLKADMESNLNIPMFSNPEWEQENSEVMALYRKVTANKNI